MTSTAAISNVATDIAPDIALAQVTQVSSYAFDPDLFFFLAYRVLHYSSCIKNMV